MTKKEQILILYNQKKLVHPSLSEIGKKVECDKTYVWKVIKQHFHYINWKKEETRNKTRRLVKKGEIIKPDKCEIQSCDIKKVEAHHTDYENPKKINWLCKKHHTEADKLMIDSMWASPFKIAKKNRLTTGQISSEGFIY